jgi:hypothetical protein
VVGSSPFCYRPTDSKLIVIVTTQLMDQWRKKKDIYSVVKALAKKSNLEPTDTIWGRWAWIVCTFPVFNCLYNLLAFSANEINRLLRFGLKGRRRQGKVLGLVG